MDGVQNLPPHIQGQFIRNLEQMQKEDSPTSNSCESSFRSKSRDKYTSDVDLSSPRHGDEENQAHGGGAKIRYYLPCLCTLVYGMFVVAIWLSASIARDKQQNAKQSKQQQQQLASSSGASHAPANPHWYTTSHPDYQTILLNSPNDNASDPVQKAHLHARDFCLARSMTLCTYRRYCPDGPSSPPYDDENESGTNHDVPSTIFDRNPSEWEQWAPLASSGETHNVGNGWVQVGRIGEGGGRCWIYEDWIGDVGVTDGEVPDVGVGNLRWILCCPVEEGESASASASGNNSGGSNSGSGSANQITGDSGGV